MRELEQYSRSVCPWGYNGDVDDLKRYHALSKMTESEKRRLKDRLSLVLMATLHMRNHSRGVLVERETLEGSQYEIGGEEHETIVTKDAQPLEQSIDAGIDFGSEQHTVDAFAYRAQALKKQSLRRLEGDLRIAIADYRRDMAEIRQEDLHKQHPELSHLGYYDRYTKL